MTDDQTSPRPNGERDGNAVPVHLTRNVQAVTEISLQAERTVDRHQRAIESGTARLGRPSSLYIIVAIVLAWVFLNGLASRLGLQALDPPPFAWLQGVIGLSALLTATMVLITQNRQAKLIERRMHLDLQVNLLTEQKAAKLIELLEELRRDLPDVQNRPDSEAEAMQHATAPIEVLTALEEETQQALDGGDAGVDGGSHATTSTAEGERSLDGHTVPSPAPSTPRAVVR